MMKSKILPPVFHVPQKREEKPCFYKQNPTIFLNVQNAERDVKIFQKAKRGSLNNIRHIASLIAYCFFWV